MLLGSRILAGAMRHSAVYVVVAVVVGAAVWAGTARGLTGGHTISVRTAPWSVYIRSTFSHDEHLYCSGSIIDAGHVLTAAHCLASSRGTYVRPGGITIEAGVSNGIRQRSGDRRQTAGIRNFRVDPAYHAAGFGSLSDAPHDLAVLALSRPLDLSRPTARSVALLPLGAPVPVGPGFELAGFGDVAADRVGPSSLKGTRMTVIPSKRCPIARSLCAYSPTSAICSGDSGAGLVAATGQPVLVGVAVSVFVGSTSPTRNPCTPGRAGLYSYLGTNSARNFIHGTSPPGPPPPAPASRWVPSGWTSVHLSATGRVLGLAYSLPRAWVPSTQPSKAGNPITGAELQSGASPGAGSQDKYFASSEAFTRTELAKIDPSASMSAVVVQLPGATALKLVARYTKTGRKVWVESYFVFHDGTGYVIQYAGYQSKESRDRPIFEASAKTIHFR